MVMMFSNTICGRATQRDIFDNFEIKWIFGMIFSETELLVLHDMLFEMFLSDSYCNTATDTKYISKIYLPKFKFSEN